MKILGAVVAGGRSSRFGADKAVALIDGLPMIERAIESLRPQTDALVVCGREWPGFETLADRPLGGLGPLAGLNAALHHAQDRGYDAVLAIPLDVHPLPPDMVERLSDDPPAVFENQHAIGLWPAALSSALDAYLANGGRSIRGWIEEAGARRAAEPVSMRNINRPEDL